MRRTRCLISIAIAACLALGGCVGQPAAPTSTPASVELSQQQLDGVKLGVPAGWTAAEPEAGQGQTFSDPTSEDAITIIVAEVTKESPTEDSYDAAGYLERAAGYLVDNSFGIQLKEGAGPVEVLSVPGAENAASLTTVGNLKGQEVEISLAAAQVGPNIAVVIARGVDSEMWRQTLSTLEIDPSSFEPS